ncbi:MAG: cation transporter [Pseudobutyrivibrio sp.]|nr:cation transporter [Pseudobutyrivibrio sp.]
MNKTTLTIDGMMCGMCEAHVNDVIRKLVPEAKKVSSSHTKGVTTFLSEVVPDEEELKTAISDTGYTLLSMTSEPYTKKFLGLF